MMMRLARMATGDHAVRLAMMRGVRRRLRLHMVDRWLVVVGIDLRLCLGKACVKGEHATRQK